MPVGEMMQPCQCTVCILRARALISDETILDLIAALGPGSKADHLKEVMASTAKKCIACYFLPCRCKAGLSERLKKI